MKTTKVRVEVEFEYHPERLLGTRWSAEARVRNSVPDGIVITKHTCYVAASQGCARRSVLRGLRRKLMYSDAKVEKETYFWEIPT